MQYTTRPISDRTWLRPDNQRQRSRFDTAWSTTLEQLGREIDFLGGRDVVIECDVREQDIRLDGMLRATAKADSPAVVVAFETRKHGPMLYRCDRYSGRWNAVGWQQNVRAIARTLEALRAVDRYGATETGQQYAGFKALPAGRAMPASHMTSDEAWDLIERLAIGDEGADRLRSIEILKQGGETLTRAVRDARSMAHPDRRDGDHDLAYRLDEALRVLGL